VPYQKKEKAKPTPQSHTNNFIRDTLADPDSVSDKIGKEGLLLTEQTLLTMNPETKRPQMASVAFSTVPADGKNMDDDTKMSFAEHFRFFHSVLLPSSTTKSAPLMNAAELEKHYLTDDGRALLLCMLAVSTGFTSMKDFQESAAKRRKEGTVSSTVMAIGMAVDLLQRAVNPNEVGPAVKCLSNVYRHAGDSETQKTMTKFKVMTSASAGGKADA